MVAISLESANSGALRGAHDNLQSQVSRYRQEAQEETDLILFVSRVLAQRSGIDKKLADTISAMMEFSLLFRNQSECYEKISRFVNWMQPSQDLEALKSRKMFIQYQIDTCANKLREVSERSLRKMTFSCFPSIFLPHTLQLI
jgi:chaperonin cofactor prefoldin